MRFREPLLYEQYIGQYLSDEEILQRSEEAMQKSNMGLSDLLINSYQEKELQKRLQEEQSRENCVEQEEEEGELSGARVILTGWGIKTSFLLGGHVDLLIHFSYFIAAL